MRGELRGIKSKEDYDALTKMLKELEARSEGDSIEETTKE